MEHPGTILGVVFIVLAAIFIVGLFFVEKPKPENPADLEPQWQAFRAALADAVPVDAVLRAAYDLLREAGRVAPLQAKGVTEQVYQDFLRHLRQRSDLAPGALWAGRQVYANRRLKGVLSVYDEQALLNDIIVHGGAASTPAPSQTGASPPH